MADGAGFAVRSAVVVVGNRGVRTRRTADRFRAAAVAVVPQFGAHRRSGTRRRRSSRHPPAGGVSLPVVISVKGVAAGYYFILDVEVRLIDSVNKIY